MTCAELEILICDYVDGTLPPDMRAEVELHLGECPACAELARDSAEAVAFMERAAEVEPPPELITKILFDAPWSKAKKRKFLPEWMRRRLDPILQPRLVMGALMTLLSFSMLARYVPMRQIKPSDLTPSAVWATIDNGAQRAWARTVKYYENLKVVYQIQGLLREWQQQEDEQKPTSTTAQPTVDDRKLPVKGSTTGGTPSPTPPAGSR